MGCRRILGGKMRFITLNENNRIFHVRYGDKKTNVEIESTLGELGQVMLEDGTFIDYVPTPEELQEQLNTKRKQELIKLMIEANALRDDVAWLEYKTEYEGL